MRQSSLLIIFLVVFLDWVGFGIVLPVLPFYAQNFGATGWQLGWLVASYAILQLAAAPILGRVSDFTGRRPVLLASLLGTSMALAILGVAGSLQWLFIGRIIAGACGANLSTAYAYVADVVPETERPAGIGTLNAGYGLGLIFGPAIGGILARYGFSAPMFAAAALAFANFVFALWRLEEPKLAQDVRCANRGLRLDSESVSAALSDRRLRLAIGVFFLASFAIAQMEAILAYYLGARYSYGAESTGVLLAVMALIAVAAQGGLVGKLIRRYGEPKTILAGALVGSACMALAVTVPTVYLGAPLFCLVALGCGLLQPSLSGLASASAPIRHRGTPLGLFHGAGGLARALGPPLAGWLYDHVSWRAPFYWSSLTLALAFVATALWYAMHLRRQGALDRIAAG